MNSKTSSIALKVLSLALSLMMVFSVIPVQGIVAFAADEYFCIQYLEDGKIRKDVDLKLKTDENADDSYEGITDSNGVWVTPVTVDDLAETFVVYINEDAKIIEKPEDAKNYLIIDKSETSWSDTVAPVTDATIIADNTDIMRGDTLTLSVSVKGTPSSYQWYKDSEKIDGATSALYEINNAQLTDAGKYSCKVTDIEGNNSESDVVTVKVSEKKASKLALKAYAGSSEIKTMVSRNDVSEIELRLVNLPDDANAAEVAYYVNGSCVSSGTSETSYVFALADAEEYTCYAEVSFDRCYEDATVELSAPIEAPLLSDSSTAITVDVEGAESDASGVYNVVYSASPRTTFKVIVSADSNSNSGSSLGGSGLGGSLSGIGGSSSVVKAAYDIEILDEKDASGNSASGKVARASTSFSKTETAWTISIFKAGTFKIKVYRAKGGSEDPVYLLVNVAKATPEGFAFVTEAPEAVTYNENGNKFTNPVVDGFSDVVYSIVSGDCATIDEATGELSITKSGEVTVKATLEESNNFEGASATYTLTVNKAAQAVEFEEKAEKIFYGEAYSRVANPVKVEAAGDGFGYNHDEGVKVEYSISGDAIATVNEDGSLTFVDAALGTVTVKATLAGNDCYEAAEAEYTLTVEAYTVENPYTVNGDKIIADGEWYTGDITVIPAENHLIGKANNLGDYSEWAESIVIDAEGEENGFDFYLKNIETGAISQVYTVESDAVKLDKTAPKNLKVSYKTQSWYDDVIESITFGYYNSIVTFVLEAQDDVSGIEYFVWQVASDETDEVVVPETTVEAIEKDGAYESAVCVLGDENDLQELRGKISFVAYDFAGNSEEHEDSYVIVIDAQDPELYINTNVSPETVVNNAYPYAKADESAEDAIEIYGEDIELTFGVIEKNFFEKNAYVEINGKDVTSKLSWVASGDNHSATYKLSGDDDYEIKFVYEDVFGDDAENKEAKKSYEASKMLAIDTEAQDISVSLSAADFEADGVKYYDDTVTVEITVEEEKFNPAGIAVSTVEGYKGMSAENVEYLKNADSWTYADGIYTATAEFAAADADGDYAFAVDYTDLAKNTADQVESGVFVIDTTAPETKIESAVEAVITVNDSYPYETVEKDAENSVDIFASATEFVFTITEKNFFADRAEVTVNGSAVSLEWNSVNGINTAAYTIEDSGDYTVVVSYEDIFEAAVYESADFVAIDNDAPSASIELSAENQKYGETKYYNNNVTAIITVDEIRFRPSEFAVSEIEALAGMSAENKEYLANPSSWTYEDGSYTASVVFNAENADANYAFAVDYTDLSGKAADQAESGTFVIDTIKPVITASYGEAKILDEEYVVIDSFNPEDYNSITIFDDKDIVVTVKIDELNFDPEKAVAMLAVNGGEASEIDFYGEWTTEGTVHTNTITLTKEDSYKLAVYCTDMADNVADEYNSPKIVYSKELPSVNITIATENDVENTFFNKDKVEVVIRVFDEYFDEGRVVVTAKDKMATDINGKEIALSDADIIPDFSDDATWTEEKNADGKTFHSTKLTFSTEARYAFEAEYKNAVGSTSSNDCSFVLDRTGPGNLAVEYSAPKLAKLISAITFNYYNAPVTVTLTADDDIAGVKKMDWKYTKEAGASNVNLESATGAYEYEVSVNNGKLVVNLPGSDDGALTVSDLAQIRGNISFVATDASRNVSMFGDNEEGTDESTVIIVDTISPTREVEFSEPTVTVGEKLYYAYIPTVTVRINEANFYAEDVVVTVNGEQKEALEWTQNGDEWTASFELTEDGDYVIGVTYTDRSTNVMEAYTSKTLVVDTTKPVISSDIAEPEKDGNLQLANAGIIFTVKEVNFDVEKFNIEIKATDVGNYDVPLSGEIQNFFKNPDNWKHSEDNTTHTIWIQKGFEDAIYFITVKGEDIACNKADNHDVPPFIVDGSGPINLEISYSTPKLAKLISAVTFNYYNAPVIVTLTAEDSTSTIKQFDWTYTVQKGASASNISTQTGTVEIESSPTISVDEERNIVLDDFERTKTVQFKLPDTGSKQYRGNISFTATDRANNPSDVFTDTKNIIVVDTIAPAGPEVTFSEAKNVISGKHYYDEAATATIKVTEANFYPEEVDLRINDEPCENVAWTQDGDVWTGVVTISGDGHYFITMKYSDRSTNKMADYTSEEIIIDTYAPEILVEYTPDEGLYNVGNRKYFNDNRTAKITITEHNFDPSLVTVNLTAEDISDNPVNVGNIASGLSWSSNGDVHTADITYSESANYTFSISCTDLTNRTSAEYTPDEFTVDKTAPTNFDVKFSESIFDTIIEAVSFGFYNAPVKVTVSADDDISGIGSFTYTYTDNSSGTPVSETKTINVASNGTAHATETFYVPAGDAQFNGTIKVSATDNAGNKSSEYKEDKTLIVDTIAPVGSIELSDAVSINNGVHYYAGDVTATLTVTEDNFHSEDVTVYVDGNAVAPSAWTSNGNVRTATVVISADGEHKVSMSYTDKSSNKMEDVETAMFVIDHTAPVIVVSGIQNNSANNGEKVGFTIKAEDTNFVASGFEAVLTAVVTNEDKALVTERINLSGGYSTGNGYVVTVDNLEKDGVYTLTCKAVDLCGNTTTTMSAGGSQISALRFSVNRNGSTFSISDATKDVVNRYYVTSVDNNIVITETNVDPIAEYRLTMNGTELVAGEDYTVSSAGGNGEWYINTYTIAPSMFAQDGGYNIIVNSIDNANTESYSDIKGAKVSFIVDSSAPTITVSGMQAEGRYQTDMQTVTLVPADDGGSLHSVKVEVTDANGNVLVPFELSGEQLDEYLSSNNGQVTFTLGEGVRQSVRVICVDKAGNTFDSEQTYNDITVSSSKAVLVWETYGTYIVLGGVGLVAAAIIIIILAKKKKKGDK